MPRTARLDIQGLLQHVIVRGIERRDIFLDDDDRQFFVQRFSYLLEKTGTVCFAWALLSTHLHLLVCPRNVTLATFMRRLLTSYAVTFNLRHGRTGHLFQNRYKSIVCDEDEYLLELVRYIHLNPIRAGIVADIEQLERYPWSGHSVLMGKAKMAGQDVESVLSLFGKKIYEARRRYRLFVHDGIAQGRRDDLVGQLATRRESLADSTQDARILGDSDFVATLQEHECLGQRLRTTLPLSEIAELVANRFDIPIRALAGRSRLPGVVNARAVACHVAIMAGHSAAAIGRHLNMSRYGASTAAVRGTKLLEDNEALKTIVSDIEKSRC
ncbi:MAG: transposase [Deltaproteobacteria bacterium]|nr:transposase [Deltaproteobacteria bacterium]